MAVSLATISTDCVLLLNAGSPGAYSATVLDPRWNTTEVVDAVLMADGAVIAAILKNSNNPRASSYHTTQSGLAHGGTISQPASLIINVTFVITGGTAPGNRPGVEWDSSEIQWEVAHAYSNPLGLDFDCHYHINQEFIFHNGAVIAARSGGGTVSVNVTYGSFTKTSACQAADEYAWAVLCGAMSFLTMAEGENVAAEGSWIQLFEWSLTSIASGDLNAARAAIQQRIDA